MPAGDRTGPAGMGPMTGRALGYCAGYAAPGFANAGYGRGMGRGAGRGFGRGFGGRGRGWGWRGAWGAPYAATQPDSRAPVPGAEQELNALKDHADFLSRSLRDIQTRIGQLESGTQDP